MDPTKSAMISQHSASRVPSVTSSGSCVVKSAVEARMQRRSMPTPLRRRSVGTESEK